MAYCNGTPRTVVRTNNVVNRNVHPCVSVNPIKDNSCPCQDVENMNKMKPECERKPWTALAISYVPMQVFDDLYNEEKAFLAGTAFPELDLPFLAGGRTR